MPLYEYKCRCGNEFERLVVFDDASKRQTCSKCKGLAKRQISSGIVGLDGNPEPWHYDYTKKLKPKFVRDSKGHRHKYDPTRHTGGKGRGR